MISCNTHDFVEIACMYKLPLLVTCKNFTELEGSALDIKLDENKQECLVLLHKSFNHMVLLEDIKSMTCPIKNRHFLSVDFATDEYTQYPEY